MGQGPMRPSVVERHASNHSALNTTKIGSSYLCTGYKPYVLKLFALNYAFEFNALTNLPFSISEEILFSKRFCHS